MNVGWLRSNDGENCKKMASVVIICNNIKPTFICNTDICFVHLKEVFYILLDIFNVSSFVIINNFCVKANKIKHIANRNLHRCFFFFR